MRRDIGCGTAQERMSVALIGELPARERFEADAHAAACPRCASAMRDLGATAVALERAYAPLRDRPVTLSAARVRLAIRTPVRSSRIVRYARLTAKLNELAVAAAVMLFAVIGTLPAPAVVSGTEPVTALRLRNAWAEQDRSGPYLVQRVGRYLLHDTLLDAGVVPLSDAQAAPPSPAWPGERY